LAKLEVREGERGSGVSGENVRGGERGACGDVGEEKDEGIALKGRER